MGLRQAEAGAQEKEWRGIEKKEGWGQPAVGRPAAGPRGRHEGPSAVLGGRETERRLADEEPPVHGLSAPKCPVVSIAEVTETSKLSAC